MKFGILVTFSSVILSSLSGLQSEKTDGYCYGLPTYAAIKSGPYQCKLWQSHWSTETFFEMNFLHCQESPTIHLFIRNFYGADEINTNFNRQYRKLKLRLFTGKLAQIIIVFKTIKQNKLLGIRPQVRVLVIFKPNYYLPEQQQLLTGVFYTDMKDDCNVFEMMPPHSQIFLSLGLITGLVLLPMLVCVIRKWRKESVQKPNRKPFCTWLLKCDQPPNEDNEDTRALNGNAVKDRLL